MGKNSERTNEDLKSQETEQKTQKSIIEIFGYERFFEDNAKITTEKFPPDKKSGIFHHSCKKGTLYLEHGWFFKGPRENHSWEVCTNHEPDPELGEMTSSSGLCLGGIRLNQIKIDDMGQITDQGMSRKDHKPRWETGWLKVRGYIDPSEFTQVLLANFQGKLEESIGKYGRRVFSVEVVKEKRAHKYNFLKIKGARVTAQIEVESNNKKFKLELYPRTIHYVENEGKLPEEELDKLIYQGREWAHSRTGTISFDFAWKLV